MQSLRIIVLLISCIACSVDAENPRVVCRSFGEKAVLKTGSQMPYTMVLIGKYKGWYLIDFGTTASTIDTNLFLNGAPSPVPGTQNRFKDFQFFGPWNTVTLIRQDHSAIQGIRQAGILGTDFLSLNIFTLDYKSGSLYRASEQEFCSKDELEKSGFSSASAKGYYSNDLNKLKPNVPNVPAVPIQIGRAEAIAQIDPGYDDRIYRYAININQAYFDIIQASGAQLIRNPSADLILSTCIFGLNENIKAYRLPAGTFFSITATDGSAILKRSEVNIFLKQTPEAAYSCGGIGTWDKPGAQIGASFLLESEKVIFDPFRSKVWFYNH